jgi:hypothetical protein
MKKMKSLSVKINGRTHVFDTEHEMLAFAAKVALGEISPDTVDSDHTAADAKLIDARDPMEGALEIQCQLLELARGSNKALWAIANALSKPTYDRDEMVGTIYNLRARIDGLSVQRDADQKYITMLREASEVSRSKIHNHATRSKRSRPK